jgi:hypothetical protein
LLLSRRDDDAGSCTVAADSPAAIQELIDRKTGSIAGFAASVAGFAVLASRVLASAAELVARRWRQARAGTVAVSVAKLHHMTLSDRVTRLRMESAWLASSLAGLVVNLHFWSQWPHRSRWPAPLVVVDSPVARFYLRILAACRVLPRLRIVRASSGRDAAALMGADSGTGAGAPVLLSGPLYSKYYDTLAPLPRQSAIVVI